MKIDKVYLFLALIFIFTTASWVTSCTHNANIDNLPLICFERDVLPIFQNNCAISGCHNGTGESGLILNSYVPISHAVEPGKPYSSRIYNSIIATSGENVMPPNQPLSKDNRTIIRLWIEQGALNQYCAETCDTINPVTFAGIIWPVMQTSCTGCHSGASPSGGIALANYSNVAAAAANGSLLNSLKGTGVTKMPYGGSFSACRIRQFEIWINNGYLNN